MLTHQPCISSLLLYHQNFEDIEETADQPKNEKVSLSLDPISEPGTNFQNSDDALALDIQLLIFDMYLKEQETIKTIAELLIPHVLQCCMQFNIWYYY